MMSVDLPLVPRTQMEAVAVVEDTQIEQHADQIGMPVYTRLRLHMSR